MKSKPVALLLADLGVIKTHSRPHVSDDNPYSESQFRTLKYRPGFPDRFGSIEDARGFCQIVLPLVQPPAPSLRTWPDDSGHGPPRPSRSQISGASPSGPGRRIPRSSRALRPETAPTAGTALPGLDQPATFRQGKYSLNFYACVSFLLTRSASSNKLANPNHTLMNVWTCKL